MAKIKSIIKTIRACVSCFFSIVCGTIFLVGFFTGILKLPYIDAIIALILIVFYYLYPIYYVLCLMFKFPNDIVIGGLGFISSLWFLIYIVILYQYRKLIPTGWLILWALFHFLILQNPPVLSVSLRIYQRWRGEA
jgi:hypothetical protein